MEQWIQQMIEQFGYWGVLFLIFIENVFPPIPSELILIFGGFFTTTTTLTPVWMILAATVGAVIGAIVLYSVGLFFDKERLESWVARYGKRLYLKVDDVRMADRWFDRFGPKLFVKFLMLTTLGTLIWNTVLIFVGVYVGENWQVWLGQIETYSHVMYGVLAVILLGLGAFIVRVIWSRRSEQR